MRKGLLLTLALVTIFAFTACEGGAVASEPLEVGATVESENYDVTILDWGFSTDLTTDESKDLYKEDDYDEDVQIEINLTGSSYMSLVSYKKDSELGIWVKAKITPKNGAAIGFGDNDNQEIKNDYELIGSPQIDYNDGEMIVDFSWFQARQNTDIKQIKKEIYGYMACVLPKEAEKNDTPLIFSFDMLGTSYEYKLR